jgi:cis-3-alkyl-4-acyloxetan-2-one decarboxylase
MVSEAQGSALPAWLSRQYPFQRHAFRTPGGALMNYLDEGPRSEEAVVMLHGNPTWSFYYRNLVRLVSPSLRCVVPDHVGMGLSEKPQDYPYTLKTRIDDVAALVASLGLKRVHLVVHDWGGAIGMGLAGRNPERVGRIVVLNTAAFVSSWIPRRISLCRAPYLGALVVRGLNGFVEPATWMAMRSRRLTWDERRAYLFPHRSWSDRVAVHQFVRDIPLEPGHKSRGELERVEAGLASLRDKPMLIVWGAKDFCFDDRFLSVWRDRFPEARVERLARAGHYVLEDAAEDAARLIPHFLIQNT